MPIYQKQHTQYSSGMTTGFTGRPEELTDEQLIRLHRQLKSEAQELKTLCEHIDIELKNRIKKSGPVITPSGKADIITRHLKTYLPNKIFGILGAERFIKVVSVSSTKLQAFVKSDPSLEYELRSTYTETTTEVLDIR